VLVDAYTWLREAGRLSRATDPIAITPDDIEGILDHEGCHLAVGDILLLRTHWLGAFRMADAAEREAIMKSGSWPGLYPGEEMAEFLWDNHIAAVVADNRAVEVAPGSPELGYLHRRLLSLLGIPLGELWELEKLTARCSMRKCYECLVVSVPLNLRGGVGSPSNAIAIL
jgi:kynurenine formamidase